MPNWGSIRGRRPDAGSSTTVAPVATKPILPAGKKGPVLAGLFKQQYLSKSGLPANDEQVGDIIRDGRTDMPAYGDVLTQKQMEDLMAYLHTL